MKQSSHFGVPGAPGVGVGWAWLPPVYADLELVPEKYVTNTELEIERYNYAVNELIVEMQKAKNQFSGTWSDGLGELFDVYRQLAADSSFNDAVIGRIRNGIWAPAAVRDTVFELSFILSTAGDERLKARAEDIRSIGRQLLLKLNGDTDIDFPDRCILIGREISIARIAKIPSEKLAGIVSFEGSVLSHTALLARALNIPAVVGLGHLSYEKLIDKQVVVDGYTGRIIINPDSPVLNEYTRLMREELKFTEQMNQEKHGKAVTFDGIEVKILANLSVLADIDTIRRNKLSIGLFRTEFPFMLRETLPGENEQIEIYRYILESIAPAIVVMRTLDAGGDKPLSYLSIKQAESTLGLRGIRFGLNYPEIFVCQIRAMLRSSEGLNNLKILLPMVSTINEIVHAKKLIHDVYLDLIKKNLDIIKPSVGVMLEVPSFIFKLRDLVEYVDFVSIGTNDLTQYIMAADRSNWEISDLHDHFQPSVLCALRYIINELQSFKIEITVCGDLASDPLGVFLLLGMGVDNISVSSSSIGVVSRVIRNTSCGKAEKVVNQLLQEIDSHKVKEKLIRIFEDDGMITLIRAGDKG